ncbi:hypothetical protein FY550_12855 [Kushneria phosphatilytica]|uniref:DUF5666 domain-containing protein n=1 Tax=Kushneria phosphatilytica TaxID=657387 RepID=A0A5C1A211_9GAMM|nr:hypothetical protein [Kushneria phosphatilytica]QEL11937.1 hypothetical protein FY550_12855 [Kushneria phosphatilytica]
MVNRLASATLGLLLLGGISLAHADAQKVVHPMRGTINQVSAKALDITTARGDKHLHVQLTDQTKVAVVTNADFKDIKPDSYIGSAAIPQPDGTLKALEVHVFAPSMKGTGEGHYGWENADGSMGTMTNGSVGSFVKSSGRTLVVDYNGQQKKLTVPENVPIVSLAPGSHSDLKAGEKLVLFPTADSQNDDLVADRISVGRDGVAPPM